MLVTNSHSARGPRDATAAADAIVAAMAAWCAGSKSGTGPGGGAGARVGMAGPAERETMALVGMASPVKCALCQLPRGGTRLLAEREPGLLRECVARWRSPVPPGEAAAGAVPAVMPRSGAGGDGRLLGVARASLFRALLGDGLRDWAREGRQDGRREAGSEAAPRASSGPSKREPPETGTAERGLDASGGAQDKRGWTGSEGEEERRGWGASVSHPTMSQASGDASMAPGKGDTRPDAPAGVPGRGETPAAPPPVLRHPRTATKADAGAPMEAEAACARAALSRAAMAACRCRWVETRSSISDSHRERRRCDARLACTAVANAATPAENRKMASNQWW
eukprot:scaffold342_cov106-Isochrysis_galbana.AAC.4